MVYFFTTAAAIVLNSNFFEYKKKKQSNNSSFLLQISEIKALFKSYAGGLFASVFRLPRISNFFIEKQNSTDLVIMTQKIT